MAGDKHQFMIGLIVRKMREDGVNIFGIDGNYPGLFGRKISMPPQILRHRPDIIGIKKEQICLGEAKTDSDLGNPRMYEQLRDFTSVRLNGMNCAVYYGIPESCRAKFDSTLKRTGLAEITNIQILYIPNELLDGK